MWTWPWEAGFQGGQQEATAQGRAQRSTRQTRPLLRPNRRAKRQDIVPLDLEV